MLEQLLQNFEPILATYGIWVALFFAIMVLGPVAIVVWLQKRGHEPIDDTAYLQSLSELLQQVQSLETVLNQYQQQSSHFYDATRREMGDILQQQEDCLGALLRLKSEIKSTEERLPELGHRVEAALEEFQEEITGLKARFESIKIWYHGLPQKLADGRTHLHQLQTDLGVYPLDAEPIEPLHKRLRALQNQTSPQDPIAYWYAVQQLAKEIAEIDPQAVEAAVKAQAEAAQASVQPAIADVPSTEPAPASVHLAVDDSTQTEATTAAITEPVQSHTEPTAISESVQPEKAPPESSVVLIETVSETASEPESQSLLIKSVETAIAPPLPEAVTEPVQQVSVNAAVDTSIPDAVSEETEPVFVEPEVFDSTILRQSMRADFDKAELQISDFADCLQEFETLYQEYENRFAPETWPEHGEILEHSQYLFQEAMQLHALAEELLEVPQAPQHRIQLNLLRLQHKYQDVQNNLRQLQRICKDLEQNKESLQSRLMQAANQLHQLRNTAEPNWIMQQAGLLKELRQAIDRQPLHLAICQSQLKQIEGEIATQVQVES